MGKPEGAEGAFVQVLRMRPCTSEPSRDGRLPVTKDPFGGGCVQPFGQRCQNQGDLMGRGFQTVQGRVASRAERGAAGLTAQRLDLLSPTVLVISHQRMDVRISDPAVRALRIGTGETLRVYAFGSPSPAFDLAPGPHRQRRWLSTRRGSGGESPVLPSEWERSPNYPPP